MLLYRHRPGAELGGLRPASLAPPASPAPP